jgi:predicted aminopeptidase
MMRTQTRRLARALKSIAAFAACLANASCWYLEQGAGLVSRYARQRPVAQLLSSGRLAQDERAFLTRAMGARDFAMRELGLKANRNYSGYARVEGEALAWVVSACAADSFDELLFDYPLVGALPYKGYFDKAKALAEAERLRARGYDVLVRGVGAFSTLGILPDPLFSFMASYGDYRLASLIIHEQTHATVFLKGWPDFNENLADFVGREGALLYLESLEGPDSRSVEEAKAESRDAARFARLMAGLRAELAAAYAGIPSREDRLLAKHTIIARFQQRVAESLWSEFETEGYRAWRPEGLDNAYLSLYRVYTERADELDALYRASGLGLKGFVALVAQACSGREDPMRELARAVEGLGAARPALDSP